MNYRRLAILLFVVYLLPMLGMAKLAHDAARNSQVDKLINHLESVAIIQAQRIHEAVHNEADKLALIASRTQLRIQLKRYLDDGNQASIEKIQTILKDAAFSVPHVARLAIATENTPELVVVNGMGDTPGRVVRQVSLPSDNPRIGTIRALRDDKGHIFFVLTHPLKYNNHALGDIAYYIHGHALTGASMDTAGLGRTGETLIGALQDNGNAIFLSPTRFDPSAGLLRELAASETDVPMIRVLRDIRTTTDQIVDYAGNPVFEATSLVPEIHWAVVTKMRTEEVLEGLDKRLTMTVLTTLIAGALLAIVTAFLVTRRIGQLARFTRKFLNDHPLIPVHRSPNVDELEELRISIQAIIRHIESSRQQLAREVTDTSRALDTVQADLRIADEALMHSAKLAAIGELSTEVAHEVNQPITALQLKLETIQRKAKSQKDEKLVEQVDACLGFIARMRIITDRLRNLGRKSEQAIVAVNIKTLITKTVALFSDQFKKRGIKIVLPRKRDWPDAYVDIAEGEFEQVIINLVANARDALENTSKPKIRIEAWVNQDQLVLRVEDNGPGVPTDLQSRIFETFYTSKPEGQGTGLGLSISRRFIHQAGGELSYDTDFESGAAFIIKLPISKARS